MNRNELAKELNVQPWDIDDWLLWGCPAEKIRTAWEFDLEKVKICLDQNKRNKATIFTHSGNL